MRVIICGGRDYRNSAAVRDQLTKLSESKPDLTIIHGAAPGADSLAGTIARELGLTVEAHPANWKKHGRAAGPIRNQEMLDSGVDLVVAFPGGHGTQDMISRAKRAGISVHTIYQDT